MTVVTPHITLSEVPFELSTMTSLEGLATLATEPTPATMGGATSTDMPVNDVVIQHYSPAAFWQKFSGWRDAKLHVGKAKGFLDAAVTRLEIFGNPSVHYIYCDGSYHVIPQDLLSQSVQVYVPQTKRPCLTVDDMDFSEERRRQPLPMEDGSTIPYPFGDLPIATEHSQRGAETWRKIYLAHQSEIPSLPAELGPELGRGGQHIVYAAAQDHVIRWGHLPKFAERMLVLQKVLEAYGVPHWRLDDDPAALALATRYGVTFQSRLPVGTRTLDEIVSGGWDKNWDHVVTRVEEICGPQAKIGLLNLKNLFEKIYADLPLQQEGYIRGYAVAFWLSTGSFSDATLIDHLGGNGWGRNLYYHPQYGWFLGDW